MAEYNTNIKTSSSGHSEKSNKGKMSGKQQNSKMSDDGFKEAFYEMTQSFQALSQTVRDKQSSNNSIKQCYCCSENRHIHSEYRNRKCDVVNKTVSNAHTHASNNDSFKYNPYSSQRGLRCFFCNIKNHRIAECRFKQKAEYNSNGGIIFKFCRYCKCAGHVIEHCKKRMFKEQIGNRDTLYRQPGTSNYKPNLRKCSKCQETGEF